MSSRIAICVLLAVLVASLSFAPMPVGHGPFSTVYGPATTFKAYRAAQQLHLSLTAILIALISFALLPFASREWHSFAIDPCFSLRPPASSILRC